MPAQPPARRRPRVLLIALALVALLTVPTGPGTAPASAATAGRIGPGVRVVLAGSSCAANLVFTTKAGQVFVGIAAHCAGVRTHLGQDGCRAASKALGTRVRFRSEGATIGRGSLVYSSWRAMRRAGIHDSRCASNDFALVRVDRGDRARVRSSVPHWGGPSRLAPLPAAGAPVFSYAANPMRGGAFPSATTPFVGSIATARVWEARLAPPVAARRDSGAAYLDQQGRAVGIQIAPGRIASLQRVVAFARHHGKPGLRLVAGGRFGASAVL